MKAMILAAGRGKRMGGLTQNVPKPLLKVAGKTLIEWQMTHLRDNGFTDVVVNVGYLGEQICEHVGDGEQLGVSVTYSQEPQTGLETGGGVFQALPLLGDEPFLLTNADVFCDFPYCTLKTQNPRGIHLVLVDNPRFKKTGDFSIVNGKLAHGEAYTFAGISVINPVIFNGCESGFYPILPLFRQAIDRQIATAEHFVGMWHDVGTPERLAQVSAIVT